MVCVSFIHQSYIPKGGTTMDQEQDQRHEDKFCQYRSVSDWTFLTMSLFRQRWGREEGSGDFGRVTKTSFLTSCKVLKYTYDPPPPPHHHHHHLSWQLIGNKVSIFPFYALLATTDSAPFPQRIKRFPPPNLSSSIPLPPVINEDYSPE